MSEVASVLGPVDTGELGTTLMHEHVFTLTADSQKQWSDEWDEDGRVAEAVDKLTELRASGVRTIVDPTVDGLGRDVPRVLRINRQVPDLTILVATGVYTYADVPGFFSARGPGGMAGLPEVMSRCSCATSPRACRARTSGRRSSSAPSTTTGSPRAWSGSCGPVRRRRRRPARR